MRKLRPDGSEAFAWDGTVLQYDADGIVLQAEFNVDVVELGFTTFRRGDVFVEFYYWDRWYNVFQISDPSGELKGWYCNLGQPAIRHQDVLEYVDLALDVWINPDGSSAVLDEDDLAALVQTYPNLAEDADRGRVELLAMVEAGRLPRWPAHV